MPKLRIRKKELSRGACLVAAVLLIFGGILSLVAPGSIRPNIAFVFGMIMALAGVIFLLIYALMRSLPVGAEWILADGIVALALCGQVGREELIPFSMGAWLLFSGVTRLVMAAVLLRGKIKCWRITGLAGLALLLLGLISQYGFAAAEGYAGLFEGLAFLLEGANALFLWWLWNDLPGCGEENTDTHMAIRK